MKKIVSLILASAVILGLAGCGSKKNAQTSGSGSDVLKVGMECNYAPYNWSQSDDSNGAVAIANVDKY